MTLKVGPPTPGGQAHIGVGARIWHPEHHRTKYNKGDSAHTAESQRRTTPLVGVCVCVCEVPPCYSCTQGHRCRPPPPRAKPPAPTSPLQGNAQGVAIHQHTHQQHLRIRAYRRALPMVWSSSCSTKVESVVDGRDPWFWETHRRPAPTNEGDRCSRDKPLPTPRDSVRATQGQRRRATTLRVEKVHTQQRPRPHWRPPVPAKSAHPGAPR